MDKIQNFDKGINKDISQVYQPDGTYVDALNIEVINDELQGSVAISNSRGNKIQLSIPDVDNIYKISINSFTALDSSDIDINGTTSATPFVTSTGATGKDLYDFIIADANLGPLVGVDFNIAYSNYYVVLTPIAAATLTVATTPVVNGCLDETIIVPANADPIHPIGYAVLRDDIYIFATPCYDEDPKTNGGGYGYIFKFTYNNITFATNTTGTYIAGLANLELVYANDLNFTTWYNIPQTGVVTRFENSVTKRIYWTDNYNKLRTINVVQDQLAALDPTLLDIIPAVDFDVPIMTAMGAAPGTAPVRPGCWQLAYRYKKNNGAVTSFSPLSNMVFILPADEANAGNVSNWIDYRGNSQGVNMYKQVTWTINNVDRDFDYIEFVLARRADKNDPGTFFSVDTIQVTSDPTLSITVDGDMLQDASSLTLQEFLSLSNPFSHCKTISTKDNRLVAANVRNETSELDYDARAYRWDDGTAIPATPTFKLINDGSPTGNLDASDYGSIAEDEDAICPFNLDPYGGGNYSALYKYKSDGVTIGGEGPNIDYEFVCVATAADQVNSVPCTFPFVKTDKDSFGTSFNLGVEGFDYLDQTITQEYTLNLPNQICSGIKFPQYNSTLIGYNTGETYRFAIQFYDKYKNPYFVKWIGDIRFPEPTDTCVGANHVFTDGTSTGETDFGKVFTYASTNDVFVTQVGIKFTVNIPADISEKISGYRIVRVERTEDDKQVISEGLLKSCVLKDATNDYYKNVYGGVATPAIDLFFYYSPNALDSTLTQPSVNNRLRVHSYYNAPPVSQLLTGTCASYADPNRNTYVDKYYTPTSMGLTDTTIDFLNFFNSAVSIVDGALTIYNQTDQSDNGNTCFYFRTPNGVLSAGMYLGYVYQYKDLQYSGKTYDKRASNTYIACSHFKPIRTSTISTSDTFYLFGGDVTNGIMDDTEQSGDGAPGVAVGMYYPACSPVNRELRYDAHFNLNATGVPTVAWDYRDVYAYNTAYSCQDNIVKFYPKPAVFNNTEIFDSRFYISEIKINGESQDSWGIFLTNNYWDAEGSYGAINSMIPLNDKMYFWQDKAFGVIQINPRAVVTDTNAVNNAELQIGTGLPLQRHDYITVNAGTKHQGSTVASYGKLYWYDANTFKLWSYNPGGGLEPLTDIKGLYSYFTKYLNTNIQNYDKPTCALDELTTPIGFGLNGVVAVYDNRHQRVLYTFHTSNSPDIQKSFTFAINELKDCVTSFYSFTPRMYMGDGKQVFSFDNNTPNLDKLFVHDQGNYNNFYGNGTYNSYIKFIVNPNPQFTKVFDNFVWDSQATKYVSATDSYQNYHDVTFSHIRVTNDYQNTDKQALTLNTNIKRKERSWQLDVPRNRVLYTSSNSPNIYTDLSATEKQFGERIRDKYAQVELWFTNTASNYQIKLNNFITQFRQSNR